MSSIRWSSQSDAITSGCLRNGTTELTSVSLTEQSASVHVL